MITKHNNHYHIDIIISKEDVEVLKTELKNFIDESEGAFSVQILAENDAEPSEELQTIFKKVYFTMLMCMVSGNYKEVN